MTSGSGVHHFDLVVSDLHRSLEFYRALLAPLGYVKATEIIGERGERVVYLGGPGLVSFSLRQAQTAGAHDRYRAGIHHVAFAAESRALVNERVDWARERGLPIENNPKEYDYLPGYYAGFFYDPDGIKLEIVHIPSSARSTGDPDGGRRSGPACAAQGSHDGIAESHDRREASEMSRAYVRTRAAPQPLGPYSQAVRAADLVFCSTQLPLDPETGELADGPAHKQAASCLDNLDAVCRAAGTSIASAVRITVYFIDRAVLPDIDRAFQQRFGDAPPARVPVQVVSLGRRALVSMDAIVAMR